MSATKAVLSDFFRRSSLESERMVARLRLGLAALSAANTVMGAMNHGGLLSSGVKYPVMLSVLGLAVLWSALTLRWLARDEAPEQLLPISSFVDAAMAICVLGSIVVWPSPSYPGLLALPHAFGFMLAVIVSGVRLSQPAVIFSALTNGLGAAALIAWDLTHNPVSFNIGVDDYSIFWIFFGVATGVAWRSVRRFRALVQEGGLAMVSAERARQRLGVYVSPEIAEEAMTSDILEPGGVRRSIAVLFSDLRGFTRYAERMPPERLVAELNDYLDAMVAVVKEEQGVVDKYIGDAIMVVWGIPTSRGDDAARAVRTAWKMQRALEVHNRSRVARGLEPFRQGIGVHYGEAVAGNIGTSDRLQYTVVGDAVNLASRLEQATKELGVPVLISADAIQASQRTVPGVASCGELSVRGREETMEVFGFTDELLPDEVSGVA